MGIAASKAKAADANECGWRKASGTAIGDQCESRAGHGLRYHWVDGGHHRVGGHMAVTQHEERLEEAQPASGGLEVPKVHLGGGQEAACGRFSTAGHAH
jgi:hypothetical protein